MKEKYPRLSCTSLIVDCMSNQSEDPIRHEQLSIQDEHSRFSRRNMDLFRLEEHSVKDFVLSGLEF